VLSLVFRCAQSTEVTTYNVVIVNVPPFPVTPPPLFFFSLPWRFTCQRRWGKIRYIYQIIDPALQPATHATTGAKHLRKSLP